MSNKSDLERRERTRPFQRASFGVSSRGSARACARATPRPCPSPVCRSVGPSVGSSLGRSLSRSLARSLAHSPDRPPGCRPACPPARPPARPPLLVAHFGGHGASVGSPPEATMTDPVGVVRVPLEPLGLPILDRSISKYCASGRLRASTRSRPTSPNNIPFSGLAAPTLDTGPASPCLLLPSNKSAPEFSLSLSLSRQRRERR